MLFHFINYQSALEGHNRAGKRCEQLIEVVPGLFMPAGSGGQFARPDQCEQAAGILRQAPPVIG